MASSETTRLSSRAAARTLLFRVAGTVYGCDIDAVREIIPYRRATRLPGAPPYVQGLINLRGTIVTVLDLGARLDPARAPRAGRVDHPRRRTARASSGVAVDEVMDVQAHRGGARRGAAAARAAALMRGLGHLEDDVVVLVDIHTLVTQVLL